jgi:hypothetical protein
MFVVKRIANLEIIPCLYPVRKKNQSPMGFINILHLKTGNTDVGLKKF